MAQARPFGRAVKCRMEEHWSFPQKQLCHPLPFALAQSIRRVADSVRRAVALLFLAIIVSSGVFTAGMVEGAHFTGPLTWHVTLDGARVSAQVVLGPGGPYIASHAVAELTGTTPAVSLGEHTLTFAIQSSAEIVSVPNPPNGVLLQNWPGTQVVQGSTSGWVYITPSNPLATDDGLILKSGVVQSPVTASPSAAQCHNLPQGGALCSESDGRTYVTGGHYTQLRFSLALPQPQRTGEGYALVEVWTGNRANQMTLTYRSPKVTRGFRTATVNVNLKAAQLVRVFTYVQEPYNSGTGTTSVGIALGNATFYR